MSTATHTASRSMLAALAAACLVPAPWCCGAGNADEAAAAALGRGDAAILQLVRELSEWKSRAESAEALLASGGVQAPGLSSQIQPAQAQVVSVLESERVVILSAGRSSGAVLGSLVSVGNGVVAKVVESRETVSAAILDQEYKGKLGALEGSLARLLVVRP